MSRDRKADRHGPGSQHRRARARAKQDAGPKRNDDLMDYCALLRIERRSWAEIARATGVGYSTLMEWRLLPEFEQARLRVLSAVPESVLFKARRVYEKRLNHELTRKVPDVAVAREILSWYDERIFRPGAEGNGGTGRPTAGAAVQIYLPVQNQGLASQPPADILIPRAPAPEASAPAAGTRKPGKTRRRIVAEGE